MHTKSVLAKLLIFIEFGKNCLSKILLQTDKEHLVVQLLTKRLSISLLFMQVAGVFISTGFQIIVLQLFRVLPA